LDGDQLLFELSGGGALLLKFADGGALFELSGGSGG